ncbi:MAG: ATP-dependent RecD-like DNA helicase, partial [Nevskia sp.]|nr:ATP-dependent RecD-like DNA helicase [Nevskia sp.]
TREVAVGDRLRVTGNDRALGIRNGEPGVVESVSGDTIELRAPDGTRKQLKTDRVLPVEHGYAATGHSAQGLGADRVLLDKDTRVRTTDHRSFYTDLTRAKHQAIVYTNDRQALPKAIARQSQKAAALDVSGAGSGRSHTNTPAGGPSAANTKQQSASQRAAQQTPNGM